jgi:hypothetical protein
VSFTDIEERLHAEDLRSEHEAILAAREASLRRIAARVAGGAASAEVFAAIAGRWQECWAFRWSRCGATKPMGRGRGRHLERASASA